MNKDAIEKYNSHAMFLAELAQATLDGNASIMEMNGVRQILALYLLIPYMTDSKLEKPDDACEIPTISGLFSKDIDFKDLRDAICHSFTTTEEAGDSLIIDDRATMKRKTHDRLGQHGSCIKIPIDYTDKRLREVIGGILQRK